MYPVRSQEINGVLYHSVVAFGMQKAHVYVSVVKEKRYTFKYLRNY